MKKRLILYSSTFLWLKADYGLLYNSSVFRSNIFPLTDDVKTVCDTLLDYDNLYSVEIGVEGMSESLRAFLEMVIDNGYGELSNNDTSRISFPPVLNIQSKETSLSYLSEITIYLGGDEHCPDYYR